MDSANVPGLVASKTQARLDTSTSAILTETRQSLPTSSSIAQEVSNDPPKYTCTFADQNAEDLQVEGIIERSPSPVPLEERDPEELTAEELRELVRRSRAEKATVAKVKREIKREKRTRERSATLSDDGQGEGDVTFMSESSKRQRTRESMEGAEVIDLDD